MRLSQEKIEEIRNAIDIVEFIGSFVKLKKRGKNYIGLCPFHNEKTPSFNVSPDKQMYHCFGCSVGGNAFTFLMEMEKISFIEAARSLAEMAGIQLPAYSPETEDAAREQEDLYAICRMGALFFYNNLISTTEGKFALDYLRKRGLTEETIKMFGLGYSPNSWDGLIQHAESQKIQLEYLEKVGLVRKREDGSYYDYFRGRAMFPVFSTTGRVIGFGARKIYDDDQLAKYINSPETPIYNKSRVLYGIHQAKEAMREKDFVILVEGYTDHLKTFQAGFKNVVASSGTALTVEQIQLIARYTKNITIVYDADSAGSKATMRGVDLVLENDLDVRVAKLPTPEDPDSYIEKFGREKFQNLIQNSISFIDFMAQAFETEGYFKTPEGQTKAVRKIIQTIAKIKDSIKRNFYIQDVAEKYGLYESVLQKELEKYIKDDLRRSETFTNIQDEISSPPTELDMANLSEDSGFNGNRNTEDVDEVPKSERDLLHAILNGGNDIAGFVFQYLTPEQFTNKHSSMLANILKILHETNEQIDAPSVFNYVSGDTQISAEDLEKLKHFITELIFSKYQLSSRWEEDGVEVAKGDARQIARDAIRAIYKNEIQKQLTYNQFLMKEAAKRGEDLTQYLNKHNELVQEKKFIKENKIIDPPLHSASDD
ncbi:MAG: DNA primase [Bacteroidota bacterium]|nr:DNA primase [Bacteroidota bacterium]